MHLFTSAHMHFFYELLLFDIFLNMLKKKNSWGGVYGMLRCCFFTSWLNYLLNSRKWQEQIFIEAVAKNKNMYV